jgi:hypothetical protein
MPEEKKIVRWSKTAVTDIGTSLLADYAAGRILDITSAYGSVCGPGDDLITMEELADGRTHPLTIESVTKTDNSVIACIQVTSLGNDIPYKLERIGVFAVSRDPGEPKPPAGTPVRNDKLLMVVEDVEDENGSKGVTIPAESDQLYTFKLYVVLTITNKDRLEVSVSSAGIATIGAIKDALDQHNEDPEAHKEVLAELIKTHNADLEAHAPLTARIRAMELTLNGKETILAPEGDPTVETVGAKGQHYINLKAGTEWECSGVKDGEYIWGLVDYDSQNFKSMRDILNAAAETAKQAKDVADGAAKAIAAVQNTISVIPSQSGSLTYNKERQKPSWNNLALEMMDITYGEDRTPAADFQGETDAGTYKAYVTPKEKYTWGDKSRDEKEIPWTIQRATIPTVPSVSGPLPYTGEAQAPVWQNFNPERLTKTETPQADAGTHSTGFTPKPNYQWSGGDTSTRTVEWVISKAANTFAISPSGTQSVDVGDTMVIQVTSNSDAQITATADNPASVEVTVDSANKRVTIRGTSAGSANVTISSKGSTNYADASAVVGVNVSRKVPTFSINPAGNQSLTIGGSKQIAVTTNSDGAVSVSSSAPGVATASASGKTVTLSGASAGSSTVTISVAQTAKYEAASLTLSVTVSKPTVANSTWDDIKAISDAGTAASYFATGDTKSLTLNGKIGTLTVSNLKVDAFILGINHNASKEGSNRIHWAIGKISGVQVALCDSVYGGSYTDGNKYFNMNHWGNYNYGGWKGCDMRYDILGSTNKAPSGYGSQLQTNRVGYDPANYDIVNSPLANTLAAAFPKDVRKVLKTVTKYTDNMGKANLNNSSAVTASVDYFFLLSEHEVYGTKTYANDYEKNYQAQYDYFKAGNAKDMYKHDARTTRVWVWLRSALYGTNNNFAVVGSGVGGGVSDRNVYLSGGVFAGFST